MSLVSWWSVRRGMEILFFRSGVCWMVLLTGFELEYTLGDEFCEYFGFEFKVRVCIWEFTYTTDGSVIYGLMFWRHLDMCFVFRFWLGFPWCVGGLALAWCDGESASWRNFIDFYDSWNWEIFHFQSAGQFAIFFPPQNFIIFLKGVWAFEFSSYFVYLDSNEICSRLGRISGSSNFIEFIF